MRDVGFGEQFTATESAIVGVLTNMSLERAAAYAKPCSDFLDREQFGYCLFAHRLIPNADMVVGAA
jgi:hypothetical protein